MSQHVISIFVQADVESDDIEQTRVDLGGAVAATLIRHRAVESLRVASVVTGEIVREEWGVREGDLTLTFDSEGHARDYVAERPAERHLLRRDVPPSDAVWEDVTQAG